MKRNIFLKSIFAISGIGIASTCISKPVEADEPYLKGSVLDAARTGKAIKLTGDRTITINGCTQYLDSNPVFHVNGSDIKIAMKRDGKLNQKFR